MSDSNSQEYCPEDWVHIASDFNFEDHDIIIRNSGLEGFTYDFRVHKLILKHSSPVWSAMFMLPGDGMAVGDDSAVPIMKLPEDAEEIDTVLRLIYPIQKPAMDTLSRVISALEMAVKYEIAVAVQQLAQAIITTGIIEQNPLRVFAVAVRHGLDDVKKAAYQHLLTIDFTNVIAAEEVPELSSLTALEYHNLCQKKRTRSKEAKAVINESVLSKAGFLSWEGCGTCCWFACYKTLVFERLVDNATSGALYFQGEEFDQMRPGKCTKCTWGGVISDFYAMQRSGPFKEVVLKIDSLS